MIKLLKSIFKKEKEIKNQAPIMQNQEQEKNHVKDTINLEYIKYYEDNVTIKEKGKRNNQGNIHGIVTLYDRQGNEIEKVRYSNGIFLGNPFDNKTPLEIIESLGELIDRTQDYINLSGNEIEIDKKMASLLKNREEK